MGKQYILHYVFFFLIFHVSHVKELSLLFLFWFFFFISPLTLLKRNDKCQMWVSQHETSSWNALGHSVSEREVYKRRWDIPYSFPRRTRWASFTWRTWWTLQQKIKITAVIKNEILIFIKHHRHLPCVSPFQWTESTEIELWCLIWVLLRSCLRSWLNFF